MSEADIGAVLLTLKLASVTTAVLLIVSTPLAWWLAFSPSRWKTLVSAVV
ncbi:MAG: molybdate transport system permease protein, partial [Candidatus Azotimanducaceae bacterium]